MKSEETEFRQKPTKSRSKKDSGRQSYTPRNACATKPEEAVETKTQEQQEAEAAAAARVAEELLHDEDTEKKKEEQSKVRELMQVILTCG